MIVRQAFQDRITPGSRGLFLIDRQFEISLSVSICDIRIYIKIHGVSEHLLIGKSSDLNNFTVYIIHSFVMKYPSAIVILNGIIVPIKSKQTALNLSIVPYGRSIVINFTKQY
jgi:hypothetical protein